ncbi:MAG: hypothetical protein ABIA63_01595, partial [bacterium]
MNKIKRQLIIILLLALIMICAFWFIGCGKDYVATQANNNCNNNNNNTNNNNNNNSTENILYGISFYRNGNNNND